MSAYDSKLTMIRVKDKDQDKDMSDGVNIVDCCTTNDEDLSLLSVIKGSKRKRKIQPPSSLKSIVRKTCEIKRAGQHELCSFDMLLDSLSAPVSTLSYVTEKTTTEGQELLEKNKTIITTASVGLTKDKIDYCHLRSYSWLK